MAAINALQQWCKLQCNGYRDVAIINMTTSFRDGLAFCALIHKYRPDLIDYDSLNKEDIFDNNNLAFRVAEDKLGIAALLDAEDMVALRIPDRLSVLTYVSQYYNYFHGRKPIGGVGAMKRPAEGSKEEPCGKKNFPVVAKTMVYKMAIENRPPPSLSWCSECSNVLLAGAYKPGKEPGCFICNDHQNTKNDYNKPPYGVVIQTGCPSANVESKSGTSRVQSVSRPTSVPLTPIKGVLKPVETTTPAPQPWTSSAQRTQAARQRFFKSSSSTPEVPSSSQKPSVLPSVPLSPEEEKNRARAVITKKLVEANCNKNNTRYFVIRPAERRFEDMVSSDDLPSWKQAECGPGKAGQLFTSNKELLNTVNKASARPTTVSSTIKASIVVNIRSTSPPIPPPAFNPPPPGPVSHRAPSPKQPHCGSGDLGSKNGNYSIPLLSTPPLVPVWHRVPTPNKPHHSFAGSGSTDGNSPPISPKQLRQSSTGTKNGKYFSPTNTSQSEMRSPSSHHIPMDQIVKELRDIEDILGDLERKGVEMEKRLRSCEEEGKGDILMDPLMVYWFNLIQKKQTYIRRESELVYIAKTQDLEEQQPGVEGELRRLLEKPYHLKWIEELRRESSLMERLMEIVNGRNAIVEGLDEDWLREDEEDQQLNEMMQTLGLKKSKIKRKSFKMLFRRQISKKVAVF
uniref:MICAL-like protein 2 n=1 Tax=Oncorhynchus gorbuscha TaxID=8017 RepID=UPI001EAF2A96|nr:MICAL-like protein 2 [Oncorhynchus gorbuscha]